MSPNNKKKDFDFSKGYEQLEEITRQFESGKLSLEEGLQKFEEGLLLAQECKKYLTHMGNKIIEIKEKYKNDQ